MLKRLMELSRLLIQLMKDGVQMSHRCIGLRLLTWVMRRMRTYPTRFPTYYILATRRPWDPRNAASQTRFGTFSSMFQDFVLIL